MIVRRGTAICSAIFVVCSSAAMAESGIASVYAYAGEKTANGETANPRGLTAAHKTLPFGAKVRVTNKRNGKSVVVRINDRGPFVGGRIIDLSKAAAASIGMIHSGTAKVRVTKAAGSTLAALGEATAKAKSGTASGAVAKAEISSSESKPTVRSIAAKSSKTKRVAAKASAGTQRVAKKLEAQARVQVANGSRRAVTRSRIAASSEGIRAATYQASKLSDSALQDCVRQASLRHAHGHAGIHETGAHAACQLKLPSIKSTILNAGPPARRSFLR
jgi:rare lipoprotein A